MKPTKATTMISGPGVGRQPVDHMAAGEPAVALHPVGAPERRVGEEPAHIPQGTRTMAPYTPARAPPRSPAPLFDRPQLAWTQTDTVRFRPLSQQSAFAQTRPRRQNALNAGPRGWPPSFDNSSARQYRAS
jgi:hypothetical protein